MEDFLKIAKVVGQKDTKSFETFVDTTEDEGGKIFNRSTERVARLQGPATDTHAQTSSRAISGNEDG